MESDVYDKRYKKETLSDIDDTEFNEKSLEDSYASSIDENSDYDSASIDSLLSEIENEQCYMNSDHDSDDENEFTSERLSQVFKKLSTMENDCLAATNDSSKCNANSTHANADNSQKTSTTPCVTDDEDDTENSCNEIAMLDRYRTTLKEKILEFRTLYDKRCPSKMKTYIQEELRISLRKNFNFVKYLLELEMEAYDLTVGQFIDLNLRYVKYMKTQKKRSAKTSWLFKEYKKYGKLPVMHYKTFERLSQSANKMFQHLISKAISDQQMTPQIDPEDQRNIRKLIEKIHALPNRSSQKNQKTLRQQIAAILDTAIISTSDSAEFQLQYYDVNVSLVKELSDEFDLMGPSRKKMEESKWAWIILKHKEKCCTINIEKQFCIFLLKMLCRQQIKPKTNNDAQGPKIDNLTINDKRIFKQMRKRAYALSAQPIHKYMCHNCGVLSPENNLTQIKDGHWKLLNKPLQTPPQVVVMFQDRPKILMKYDYQIKDNYVTCFNCTNKMDITKLYPMGPIVNTSDKPEVRNSYTIPKEISALNDDEKTAIALIGCFQQVIKTSGHGSFMHTRGKASFYNPTHKYKNLLGYLYDTTASPRNTNPLKIKRALQWLKSNNHLYKRFYSNYETILYYLCKQYDIDPNTTHVRMAYNQKFVEQIHKDIRGYLIKSTVDIQQERIPEDKIHFGIQHPMTEDIKEKFKTLKDIASSSHKNEYLDEKAFASEFPYGTGSFHKVKDSKMTYVKWLRNRIRHADDRFRTRPLFVFSSLDRYLLKQILGFHNNVRVVNVTNEVSKVTASDIVNNADEISCNIPHTIPGSQSYFKHKAIELLAMCDAIGPATLFITLTQNDYWPEIQREFDDYIFQDLDMTFDFQTIPPKFRNVDGLPLHVVEAFFKRLRAFKKHILCLNRKGPLGIVTDYWIRLEYQKRGALHVHILVWVKPDTMPADVVTAEYPRYNGTDKVLQKECENLRSMVSTYQIHKCFPARCYRIKRGQYTHDCKYGFPFKMTDETTPDESGLRYNYMRRHEEDSWIAPYNSKLLLLWQAHCNVQICLPGTVESYIVKYVTKAEHEIRGLVFNNDIDTYRNLRICGYLEALVTLLGKHQVISIRKCIKIPTSFHPKYRKIKKIVKKDGTLEEQLDKTLLQQYIARPRAPVFHNMLYKDYIENYTTGPRPTTGNYWINGYNRIVIKRNKPIIAYTHYNFPTLSNSERLYEEMLIMKTPINPCDVKDDGTFIFSKNNFDQTFMTECALRGLIVTESDIDRTIRISIANGFQKGRVLLMLQEMVRMKMMKDEDLSTWTPIVDEEYKKKFPLNSVYLREESCIPMFIRGLVEQLPTTEDIEQIKTTMTPSQKDCIDYIDRKISTGLQLKLFISGEAGTGKSYVLNAVKKLYQSKRFLVGITATTGIASYIIDGQTIHSFLVLDGSGTCRLNRKTQQSSILQDCDVIIIDEVSLLQSNIFNILDEQCRRHSEQKEVLFGGKHIILFGDPMQLPAITDTVFGNPHITKFEVAILKEVVRQKDPIFSGLLNRMRLGINSPEDYKLLESKLVTEKFVIANGSKGIVVCGKRFEVEYWNDKILETIPGKVYTFLAQDTYADNKPINAIDLDAIRRFGENPLLQELRLKIGCIVYLTKNIDMLKGQVNGLRCEVYAIDEKLPCIFVKDVNEGKKFVVGCYNETIKWKKGYAYQQTINRLALPLRLGYASTVHALQGSTLKCDVYLTLNEGYFARGMAYSAASRTQSVKQLYILDKCFHTIMAGNYEMKAWRIMLEMDVLNPNRNPKAVFPLKTINFDGNKPKPSKSEKTEDTQMSQESPNAKFHSKKINQKLPKNHSTTINSGENIEDSGYTTQPMDVTEMPPSATENTLPDSVKMRHVTSTGTVRNNNQNSSPTKRPLSTATINLPVPTRMRGEPSTEYSMDSGISINSNSPNYAPHNDIHSLIRERIATLRRQHIDLNQHVPALINFSSSSDLEKLQYSTAFCTALDIKIMMTMLEDTSLVYKSVIEYVMSQYVAELEDIRRFIVCTSTITNTSSTKRYTQDRNSKRQLPINIRQSHTSIYNAGDGNCWFRAIAQNLFDDENVYSIFRIMITYTMLFTYKIEFQQIVSKHVLDEHIELINTMIDMRWAENAQMYMTSALLERPIYVYEKFPDEHIEELYTNTEFQEMMSNEVFTTVHHYIDFMTTFRKTISRQQLPILIHHFCASARKIANHFVALYRNNPSTVSPIPVANGLFLLEENATTNYLCTITL